MHPPAPKSRRILVVDDNDGLREILANAVAAYGHRVVAQAADGAEAVELFAEHRPDAVLLDVQMPGTDGWQALAGILALDPRAVVVMVTSEKAPDLAARLSAAGARGYLKKPFDMARLQRELRLLLELADLEAKGVTLSDEYYDDWVKPQLSFPHKVKPGE